MNYLRGAQWFRIAKCDQNLKTTRFGIFSVIYLGQNDCAESESEINFHIQIHKAEKYYLNCLKTLIIRPSDKRRQIIFLSR